MTFKKVVYKNFKAHSRRYLSFFLCSSFTVMVFFMFSALYFNNGINDALKSNTKDILNASIISIMFFSILFLGYAYTSFSRSRKKEFGLFMILGMSNGAIKRILYIENILIASASILSGLIAGTVFSRLFFMIVVKLLNLSDIRYQYDLHCYTATIAVFIAEFLAIILLSSVIAGRVEIIESFKSVRTAEKDRFKNPLIGIGGLLLLSASLILKYLNTVNMIHIGEMSSVFVLLSFTGLYFTVSQFGNVMAGFFRRNQSLYYRNLPVISSIKQKIFRIRTVLFLLAMLSAITVYFIGSSFSTLLQAADIAKKEQPYHLAYVDKENPGKVSEKELESILNSGTVRPVFKKNVEFIDAGIATDYGYSFNVTVMSDKNFALLAGDRLKVKDGSCVMVCPDEMTLAEGNNLELDECRLTAGSETYRFRLEKQMSGQPLNKVGNLNFLTLVISDPDYSLMKNTAGSSQIGTLKLINFADWRKTSDIARKLENRLNEVSTNLLSQNAGHADFPLLGSRIAAYEKIRNEGSLLLFLTTFLGALFFISSVSIIYFKLFSEIDEERDKYSKFFHIGIAGNEFQKYISRELGVLFFLPLVIGTLLALAYTSIDLKFSPFRLQSISELMLVTLGYLIFQAIFYFMAKRKYSEEIMEYS